MNPQPANRVVTRFLWWPMYLQYEFRWLRTVRIEQVFVRCGYADYYWADVRFV